MPVIEGSSNFNISGNANLFEVHGNATIIRFGDGQFTVTERDLINDYIANLVALPDIKENLEKHSLSQSIITLPRAQAALNDYKIKKWCGPCFKGTREALLREIGEWVTGTDESRIYVLSGLAGIGKSTVAYTVATKVDDLGLLGASFFFSRDEADRKNAEKFFTTLAFQLCVYDERFSQAIGNALLTERGSAATMKDPLEQLRALILEPLRNIIVSRARPIVVVVDALDECNEQDASCVLTGLSQLVRDLPSFKVILTTRPQPLLDYHFSGKDDHKIFHMQDIEAKVVDSDIRLFLKYSLSQEQVTVRLRVATEQWYASDGEIESLVRAAGRLFIIASTSVRFILNPKLSDPGSRMRRLLDAFSKNKTPLNDLNIFFSVILRNAVDCDDEEIVDCYQAVVGIIVVVQIPLPVPTLSCLVDKSDKQIYAVLRNLQSVISLDGDDIPRIYHKSFPDYLTDYSRCNDDNLRIDSKFCHTRIAIRCFAIMNGNLKYNILGLGDPARFMTNKDGLAKQGIMDIQLRKKIPLELQYPCLYWANHFENANVEDGGLMQGIETFANEHLLHWLEVLSLIDKLDSAHRGLRIILNVLKSTPTALRQLLSDGLRFVLKFYEIIERSALHTYYSALPFAPTKSLLYHQYQKEAIHNICRVEGGLEKWDALLATSRHHEWVDNITFSPDNATFVSWSLQSLKTWDSASGTLIGKITGDQLLFAISDDFSTAASGEGRNITLYDVKSVVPTATFATLSTVLKLALSCDGIRIAAALADGTVCLWDSGKNGLIASFDGFLVSDDYLLLPGHLVFSPDGTRLAYGSVGGTKLRDGITGRLIADLNYPTRRYDEVIYSRDGSRIASLTNGLLTLWNSGNGRLVGMVEEAGEKLTITTDGSLLATRRGNKVKLWSGNAGNPLPLIGDLNIGSFDPIMSLVFSPDNILAIAIATSDIVKLYDVKGHCFISSLPCPEPRTLAFSPNCTRLAVGNRHGIVHIWDIPSIKEFSGSQNLSSRVTALDFSQNSSWLACGFGDGTIEIMETSFRKQSIATARRQKNLITTLQFDPDGKYFASGSGDETKLWDRNNGIPIGDFTHPMFDFFRPRVVALSGHMLAAASRSSIALWDCKTLSFTANFTLSFSRLLSFSNCGSLLAFYDYITDNVEVLDIRNKKRIAWFRIGKPVNKITFSLDNSQLVVQLAEGTIQLCSIFNNEDIQRAKPEHLHQLSCNPFWHGIPISLCNNGPQFYLTGLFPGHDDPVPVLWIPGNLGVLVGAQGSTKIALGCIDGRVIFLEPSG